MGGYEFLRRSSLKALAVNWAGDTGHPADMSGMLV